MSCLSGLFSQIATVFTVPQEVFLLQHRVFREYAKVAVGPDFIHTLPSFLVLAAITLVFWRNPPKVPFMSSDSEATPTYKSFQVGISWVFVNLTFWIWLIFQRIIYCSIWSYWSYDSEYRQVMFPWWFRVWSSYYPYNGLYPPVISAGFISWIISMLISSTILGCAVSIKDVKRFLVDALVSAQECLSASKCYITQSSKKLHRVMSKDKRLFVDESEMSSVCEDCRSEISADVTSVKHALRQEVTSVSYGTNWKRSPDFSQRGSPRKSTSKATSKTIRTNSDVTETQEPEDGKGSAKDPRHRRSCHTVAPSNGSDKSSGC